MPHNTQATPAMIIGKGDANPTPFTHRLRVRYAETDQMGVVYHSHYLVWCETARTELMRAAGYPYTRMEAQGLMLAVSEAALRFHAPARYDDEIDVQVSVTSVRSRAVEFSYLVLNAADRKKLVSATTTLVCLGSGGQVVAIPKDILEVLRSAL